MESGLITLQNYILRRNTAKLPYLIPKTWVRLPLNYLETRSPKQINILADNQLNRFPIEPLYFSSYY